MYRLSFLVFVVSWNTYCLSETNVLQFQASLTKELEDKLSSTYELNVYQTVRSRTSCLLYCLQELQCHSIFYNTVLDWCQTNAFGVHLETEFIQTNHTVFYILPYRDCPNDLGYRLFIGGILCYKIHTEKRTWLSARQSCIAEGGDLVVLNTAERYDYFVDVMRTDYPSARGVLIGLSDYGEEGVWRWVDGSIVPLRTRFWSKNQPDNAGSGQHVGIIRSSDYQIDDSNWSDYYGCEIRLLI